MASDKPNVLVLFTDQQRHDTIAALGNPIIKTPNLDRLCAEGTAFTSAYSPSPVCVSARCSMIFGQYTNNTGCYDNPYDFPDDGRQSYMDAVANLGYHAEGIGKCHFTPDSQAMYGFTHRQRQEEIVDDTSKDTDDFIPDLHEKGYGYICDPNGARGEMYYVPQIAQMPADAHPTQWIGDRSTKFIDSRANDDQPWLLYSSFIHPHPPFCPPNPWHKLYRSPMMPLPNVPADSENLHIAINRLQNRYKGRDHGIDQNLLRNMKAHYYACISFVDYQIGRILDSLEKTGQLDNTLILFSADHGEHLGDYNCFGKRSFHDSCARIPMIARLPGRFEAGKVVDTPVNLIDHAATIVAATGAEITTHKLDGEDLAAVADGSSRRDTVFSQYESAELGVYTVVDGNFKYAYSAPDNKEFLFDRKVDPLETRNRAYNFHYREQTQTMKQKLIKFLKENGEAAALDGDDWKVYETVKPFTDPDQHFITQDHPWADTDIPGYTD